MGAAAAAGDLLVGDPDADARAGLGGFEGEVVGGGGGREVMEVAGELSGGDGGVDFGEIESWREGGMLRTARIPASEAIIRLMTAIRPSSRS